MGYEAEWGMGQSVEYGTEYGVRDGVWGMGQSMSIVQSVEYGPECGVWARVGILGRSVGRE